MGGTLNNEKSIENIIKLLTENSLAATLIGAMTIGILRIIWKLNVRWLHEKKIINFLRLSASDRVYQYRTTEAVAAAVNLTEGRVEDICSAHKLIQRNTAQKQSWRLRDK